TTSSSGSSSLTSTSYIDLVTCRTSMYDMDEFACGSRSINRVLNPLFATAAERLMAVVVLPTPPFWLATVMIIEPRWIVPDRHTQTSDSCAGKSSQAKMEFRTNRIFSPPRPCGTLVSDNRSLGTGCGPRSGDDPVPKNWSPVQRGNYSMKSTSWKIAALLSALVSIQAYAQPAWTPNTPNDTLGTTSKVGVGTTNPTYPFQVFGNLTTGAGIQYGSICQVNSAGTAGSIQQAAEVELFPGSTGTTVGDNAGMVGFAANGNYSFGLVGDAQTAKSGGKNVGVLGYGFNNAADVAIGGYFALSAGSQKAKFTTAALIADNGDLVATAPIFLGRANGVTKFLIDKDGNVNVTGTLTATSVVNAVYGQDVAEWVQADHEIPAGTVVILNPEKNNQVMPSTVAYDTTIAGVVSAQPGMILGRGGVNKCTVATSGRVRVRVDATKGAIHIGDLLVTSD